MVNRNVICVIDGAAGSCGKAKVIGELVTDPNINIGASVTNCMPNAGHTFVENGIKRVFRNIPVAVVNPNVDLFIGAGSAIDMDTFIKEYDAIEDLLGDRKIYVHSLVPLIEEKHRERERQIIKSGSTCKGCGAVMQDKIIRDPELKFFPGYKNAIPVSPYDWLDLLFEHVDNPDEFVLLEGAQGCDLSQNFSNNYPYVTSRDVSSSRLISDTGLAPDNHFETIMVIRPFPIRISNITNDNRIIYSGAYGEGKELTWSHINLSAKYGFYPTTDEFEFFASKLNKKLKEQLLNQSTNQALMQIFGEKYENVTAKDVGLIEALEMERLIYKSLDIIKYVSDVIELPSTSDPYIYDLSEQTTVTNKERRIFDLDIRKLKYNCKSNGPYGLYLNFFQHLDISYSHVSGDYQEFDFYKYIREYLNYLETSLNVDVLALGTGMNNKEAIKRKSLIKDR